MKRKMYVPVTSCFPPRYPILTQAPASSTFVYSRPWALIFGNHDDQDDYSRAKLMSAVTRMPYSLSRAGPADVDGVGNYVLKILSGDA